MHSELSFLEIGFELFLFMLFTYKMYDLSRAYLIPNLRQKLAEEKNTQNEILEKEKLLISTHRRLENQIVQQERMFLVLEKKMQAWQAAEHQILTQRRREEATRLEALKCKRMIQQANATQTTIAHRVAKDAVDKARSNLEQQFDQATQKHHFGILIQELFPNKGSMDHE